MSLLFSSLRASGAASNLPLPPCRTCTLRLAASSLMYTPTDSLRPHTQIRGKKKKATRDPGQITVRLEKDVPSVGRKGAYVPTSRGEMRNTWFVAGTASYVSLEEQRALRRDRVPIVRDVLFLAGQEQGKKLSKRRQAQVDRAVRAGGSITSDTEGEGEGEELGHREVVPGTTVERIEPARSQELISRLVPARLDFNRQVQSQALGVIFGSVTAADVAAAVTHELSTNDEASRVIVTEEDVTFIDVKGDDGHSSTRVKSLGRFTVEIKVKGAEGPVTRTINVTSQEPEHKPLVE